MNGPVCWWKRLQSFLKALVQLEKACEKRSYTELERAGLVQMFEFTFELAWKTLKDLLTYEGIDVASPREVIRRSFEIGLLTEEQAETLLDALQKRNLLAHTYQESFAEMAVVLIKARYFPTLKQLADVLQKRAKGSG